MEEPRLAQAAVAQKVWEETPGWAPPLCPSPKAWSLEPPAYRLQDFDTLATVGTGTFGRVYPVKEKRAKHFFALKLMMRPEGLIRPSLICCFLCRLMECVPGCELFSYLHNRGLFFSAEIICAIVHSKEIIYRDLKPENILLDRDGHIKLTDFGFTKKLVDRTWTLCGTPEYLAPEVIQSEGHGRAVDWWALGILIFEMLSGFPPFKILADKIDFPRHLDFHVKDLIKKLLVVDRTRRLGNMKNGANDVKRHQWFRSLDWEAVLQRKLKPPIVPKIACDGNTSNFRTYPENDWDTSATVPQKGLEIFKNF
uniref:Uncharacterized protein n=1 Tax=Pan troglodytes TaxID=9598 RepID=A0A2I3TSY7_PANTR